MDNYSNAYNNLIILFYYFRNCDEHNNVPDCFDDNEHFQIVLQDLKFVVNNWYFMSYRMREREGRHYIENYKHIIDNVKTRWDKITNLEFLLKQILKKLKYRKRTSVERTHLTHFLQWFNVEKYLNITDIEVKEINDYIHDLENKGII